VLVSSVCWPSSVPGQSFRRALLVSDVLFSVETLNELRSVLLRPKFNAYSPREERLQFIEDFETFAIPTAVQSTISVCRDPRDDKFLSLAISGNADLILTGDTDLMVLHPFRGINILSPTDYLNR
jgi:uncharacterized protein